MAQATTKKLTKAQPVTVDTAEAEAYETTPQKVVGIIKGYKYYQPIAVLVKFELEKRNKALKIVNEKKQSFTSVINDALDLLLYARGLIKIENVNSNVVELANEIYKPIKIKRKKQTVKK